MAKDRTKSAGGPDIPARWISGIHRLKEKYLDQHLADMKLGGSTFQYPLILAHVQWLRQEDFCNRLNLDKASVARSLARLEKTGYISRSEDPQDRRAYRVKLTKTGRAILPDLRERLTALNSIIADGISTEQQKVANKLLRKMRDNLSRHMDNK